MHHGRTLRIAAAAAMVLAVVSLATFRHVAQGSISIAFGSFNAGPWPSGPDYASEVLGDPWDFNNAEDVSPATDATIGWSNFSVNSAAHPGQAGGTTVLVNGGRDTQMSPLYQGMYNAI